MLKRQCRKKLDKIGAVSAAGRVVDQDPNSMTLWIWIRNPDPENEKNVLFSNFFPFFKTYKLPVPVRYNAYYHLLIFGLVLVINICRTLKKLFLKFCGSRFMDSIRIRIHKVHCQLNF
jgi:hypothetical protein